MRLHKSIQFFLQVLLIGYICITCGCASKYVADIDADQLVAAMQDLPEAQPVFASVYFYPELNNQSGTTIIQNADSRNLKEIYYSEKEMLNLAAHASIFRWFQEKADEEHLPILKIHARIFMLEHSIKVDTGRMQPVARTKLEVYVTDDNENRIYESFFTTEATGPRGDLFRSSSETQDAYGYTIYKALALAFESAFADLSDKLNLQPANFDIDDIDLKEEIAEIH